MRQMEFFLCACCAVLLAGCSDDDAQARTRTIGSAAVEGPASKPRPAKPPVDAAIEDAIKEELKAQAQAAIAADPRWSTYPTLVDDFRRSEIPENPPANQIVVYLRGLSVRVPVETIADATVEILPERLELRLVYPEATVELVDASESKEIERAPDAWSAAAPVISDERWKAIEARVVAALGADGTDPAALAERVRQYRVSTGRWETKFHDDFQARIQLMKGALWASLDKFESLDLTRSYLMSRLLMNKTAIVASIGGPADVPIVPVLGGPVFGLMRGRGGVDREVHGSVGGADGVWIDVHIRSTDPGKSIALPEAWVNGFFDTLRPCERRVSDAAQAMQKMRAAEKSTEPSARLRAALFALSAFHLDPRPKRAEALVRAWRRKGVTPTDDDVGKLVEQIVAWGKINPVARRDLDAIAKEKLQSPK